MTSAMRAAAAGDAESVLGKNPARTGGKGEELCYFCRCGVLSKVL